MNRLLVTTAVSLFCLSFTPGDAIAMDKGSQNVITDGGSKAAAMSTPTGPQRPGLPPMKAQEKSETTPKDDSKNGEDPGSQLTPTQDNPQ